MDWRAFVVNVTAIPDAALRAWLPCCASFAAACMTTRERYFAVIAPDAGLGCLRLISEVVGLRHCCDRGRSHGTAHSGGSASHDGSKAACGRSSPQCPYPNLSSPFAHSPVTQLDRQLDDYNCGTGVGHPAPGKVAR